jgi:hypothetical protein
MLDSETRQWLLEMGVAMPMTDGPKG